MDYAIKLSGSQPPNDSNTTKEYQLLHHSKTSHI